MILSCLQKLFSSIFLFIFCFIYIQITTKLNGQPNCILSGCGGGALQFSLVMTILATLGSHGDLLAMVTMAFSFLFIFALALEK